MPEILSDKDLPTLVNTPAKRVKRAKQLVLKHLGQAAKHLDNPPMQGMFSRTLFVTLADNSEVVVQFRTDPLDLTPFELAKKSLGSLAPDARRLEDEELENKQGWAYSFSKLPGKMWLHGIAGKGAEGRITVNKSLGHVFSKGYLDDNSSNAVAQTVRPHLEAILASSLEEIAPYKDMFHGYLSKLDELAKLPLWIAHYDLNEVNVLINEDCNITGLIDWELSTPLPFGVGFGRLHSLVGGYSNGEFWVPDEFETAERGFWEELFNGMAADTRAKIQEHADLVQDAIILGTLLNTFIYENGEVMSHKVSLKALPKLTTYRIPLVRGEEPPYNDK